MKTEHIVWLDEREEKVLQDAMTQKDMSDTAVIRHFFRMGQMMDTLLQEAEGNPIGYLDDQGDFRPPSWDDVVPKMAPMPVAPMEHVNCPCWATGRYQRVEGCELHPYDL